MSEVIDNLRTVTRTAFDRVFGQAIWLESTASAERVTKLIRSLRPQSINKPLVRIGSAGDGGYIVPDLMSQIKALISPGVSTEVSFDLALAKAGVEVYMADASVDGPPIQHPLFNFHKKFLAAYEDDMNMRLDSLVGPAMAKYGDNLLLQMDIEGAEYPVILDASPATLSAFRIMLFEFHDLDRMMSSRFLPIIEATFRKILQSHLVVHIHPNNVAPTRKFGPVEIPPVMEFTFVRRDLVNVVESGSLSFPNKLDADNVSELPPVVLPDMWSN